MSRKLEGGGTGSIKEQKAAPKRYNLKTRRGKEKDTERRCLGSVSEARGAAIDDARRNKIFRVGAVSGEGGPQKRRKEGGAISLSIGKKGGTKKKNPLHSPPRNTNAQ